MTSQIVPKFYLGMGGESRVSLKYRTQSEYNEGSDDDQFTSSKFNTGAKPRRSDTTGNKGSRPRGREAIGSDSDSDADELAEPPSVRRSIPRGSLSSTAKPNALSSSEAPSRFIPRNGSGASFDGRSGDRKGVDGSSVDVIGVKEQHHVVSKSAGEGSAATSAIAPAKADVKVPHSRTADDKHSHDSAEKPWEDDAPTDSRHTSTLSVYDCVHPGVHGEYVRCQVRRDRSAPLVATYRLVLEDTQTVLLMATKMQMNWTSNYHVFDMTRGVAGPLTKKSGNYLGKLRARDSDRSDCVLMSKATEPEELAAVRFNKISLVGQYLNGSSPRKMRVILPPIDNATMRPVPNRPDAPGHKSLLDMMRASDYGKYYVFETKEPVLEDATFRLDFKGRVTVASVKNFQLVSEDDLDHVVCQFGKVGTDAYTIDFQAPFNAVQAFALAICQFNL